jgi:glycosyltransferase involved in cell wall biosynthesis
VLRDSDRILVVSRFLEQRLRELFDADPEKIRVVGNGAEATYFETDEVPPEKLDDTDPYLLAVCALESRKGAEYLIEFARQLERQRSALKIRIAGGALGLSPFLEQAESIRNIELLPYVGGEDLRALMTGALAVLVLSRYETFGIPAVEALALGTPVIAARCAALPEVVGDAALLVDPADSEDVMAAVERLQSDPELRGHLRTAGRIRAREFTWDRCAERLVHSLAF